MGVTQPRISELEKAEARGAITMASLERAAEALGCRLAYALIPVEPLGETLHKRAAVIADRQLASVEHTMRLEDQGVTGTAPRAEALRDLIAELQRRPARLWDDG